MVHLIEPPGGTCGTFQCQVRVLANATNATASTIIPSLSLSLITSSHSRDRTATNSRRNRIPPTHPHIHKISHTQQQHKKKGGFCWWQYDSSTECVVVGRSFVSLLVPTLRRKKETNERGIVGKAGKSSRLSCRLYHLIRPIGRIPR